MPLTIKAVAEKAGVSVGTVSNVLNRPSYVSAEVRERVESTITELGFVPKKSAQRFPRGRERVLGCVVPDLGHPFFTEVVLAAEEGATALGAAMVICHSGNSVEREERNLNTLIQLKVQGIIVAPVADRTPRIEQLKLRGVPMVYLDRVDPAEVINSVLVDHREGGKLVAQHLVSLGHESFAFVGTDSEGLSIVRERLQGFLEGVQEAGLDPSAVNIYAVDEWTSAESGRVVAEQFGSTSAHDRATAVFCATDALAVGFMEGCIRAGIGVPLDVSIVGYDDLTAVGQAPTMLTTIRQPRQEVGRAAIEMLSRKINHEHTELHTVFKPQLEVRESTARRD